MKKLIFFVFSLVMISCDTDLSVIVPDHGDRSILDQTIPLSEEAKNKLSGVYQVTEGSDHFGNQVVIKWSGNYISVFGQKNADYCVLQGGSNGSEVLFEGYWRYATNTETGLVEFRISEASGGDFLISDGDSVGIELTGLYGSDNNNPDRQVTFRYSRPFSARVTEKKFYIFAHRGGGRTSDLLPASENTTEIINLAERYGANAIEIDVKLSQDGVPFLYHDETINLRLTQKGPIWGNIEDFSFAQLRSFITLINGERIPSLHETLEFVLEQTDLKLVWLDMKSVKNDMAIVIPIQQEIMDRADNGPGS